MNTQLVKNRLCGWHLSDLKTYSKSWHELGGSFCTHPEVISWLSKKQALQITFLKTTTADGNRSGLYYANQSFSLYSDKYPFIFEDIVLPLHADHRPLIPIRTSRLSPLNGGTARNAAYIKWGKRKICYVRHHFSKNTVRKRKGEKNKFIRAGGEIIPIGELSNSQICEAYIRLFNLRWNNEKRCYSREALMEVLSDFRHFLFGYALVMEHKIIAIDLIFHSASDRWIYFDDVNGGYDPQYSSFRPGAVLLWENICAARHFSDQAKKRMVFSLGVYDKKWQYKNLWCDALPLGRTLI